MPGHQMARSRELRFEAEHLACECITNEIIAVAQRAVRPGDEICGKAGVHTTHHERLRIKKGLRLDEGQTAETGDFNSVVRKFLK
jgi:hypothetical protein